MRCMCFLEFPTSPSLSLSFCSSSRSLFRICIFTDEFTRFAFSTEACDWLCDCRKSNCLALRYSSSRSESANSSFSLLLASSLFIARWDPASLSSNELSFSLFSKHETVRALLFPGSGRTAEIFELAV